MGRYKLSNGKFCGVCGDKSIAKNFCVYTCESCKAFFRRHANKLDKFKCKLDDNCVIDIESRRRCKGCRLKKCYQIGMRKEWILTEEEKRVRNEMREENRRAKSNDQMKSTSIWRSSSSVQSNSSDDIFTSETSSVEISEVEESDAQEEGESVITSSDNSSSFKTECKELVPIGRPLVECPNSLTPMEFHQLNELVEAQETHTPLVSDVTSVVTSLSEVLRISCLIFDHEIRKTVKASNHLTVFKSLCEDDKITLLKYAVGEIVLLKSLHVYQKDDEYWYIDLNCETKKSLLSLHAFKQRSNHYYQTYKYFMDKAMQELDLDHFTTVLLLAIVLFNPNRPALIHRENIRAHQIMYMHLLKRYLQVKFKFDYQDKFNQMMNILVDLQLLHDKQIRHFLDEDPEQSLPFIAYSPLVKEIYDK